MSDLFIVGAKPLACHGLIASWRRSNPAHPNAPHWDPIFLIQSAAATGDGVHEPAQTVSLSTRESLLALREAIDEALREDAQP